MAKEKQYLIPLWLLLLNQIYCQLQGLSWRSALRCSGFTDAQALAIGSPIQGISCLGIKAWWQVFYGSELENFRERCLFVWYTRKAKIYNQKYRLHHWFPVWLGRSEVRLMKCKRQRVKVFLLLGSDVLRIPAEVIFKGNMAELGRLCDHDLPVAHGLIGEASTS